MQPYKNFPLLYPPHPSIHFFFGGGVVVTPGVDGLVDDMSLGEVGGSPPLPGVPPHSFLTKTVSLVSLEVYNLKSLCFTSRSFLVCLCDAKKGVLAKKWTINKIICFHSKTVLLVLKKFQTFYKGFILRFSLINPSNTYSRLKVHVVRGEKFALNAY